VPTKRLTVVLPAGPRAARALGWLGTQAAAPAPPTDDFGWFRRRPDPVDATDPGGAFAARWSPAFAAVESLTWLRRAGLTGSVEPDHGTGSRWLPAVTGAELLPWLRRADRPGTPADDPARGPAALVLVPYPDYGEQFAWVRQGRPADAADDGAAVGLTWAAWLTELPPAPEPEPPPSRLPPAPSGGGGSRNELERRRRRRRKADDEAIAMALLLLSRR
jgi:hypothetical protein